MRYIITHLALVIALSACALYPALAEPGTSGLNIRKGPADAAKKLYSAYKSCNRTAALKVASASAVNKLFGKRCEPGDRNWQFMGCDRSGTGYLCSYYYEGGGVNMRVRSRGASGFRVASVGFIAD